MVLPLSVSASAALRVTSSMDSRPSWSEHVVDGLAPSVAERLADSMSVVSVPAFASAAECEALLCDATAVAEGVRASLSLTVRKIRVGIITECRGDRISYRQMAVPLTAVMRIYLASLDHPVPRAIASFMAGGGHHAEEAGTAQGSVADGTHGTAAKNAEML